MLEFITIGNMRFRKEQIEAYGIKSANTNYAPAESEKDLEQKKKEELIVCLKGCDVKFHFSDEEGINIQEELLYLDTNLM